MNTKGLTFALTVCVTCLLSSGGWSQTVYFDDSDSDTIKVVNSHYEVRLLKVAGSIVEIADKSSGGTFSQEPSPAWEAHFVDGEGIQAYDYLNPVCGYDQLCLGCYSPDPHDRLCSERRFRTDCLCAGDHFRPRSTLLRYEDCAHQSTGQPAHRAQFPSGSVSRVG